MTSQPRPVVVASKCLGFAACRYNGQSLPSRVVSLLSEHVDFLPVCAEVEIGLGVPREPVRLVRSETGLRLVQSVHGADVTDAMTAFCREFLASLGHLDGFILKGRSPSCGIKDVKVYPAPGKVASIAVDAGFFGAAVLDAFPGLPVEDEGRLKNFEIREHFLTHLFARARFMDVVRAPSMSALVAYHSANKLLFAAYSPSKASELGRLVANLEKRSPPDVASDYLSRLDGVFPRMPHPGLHVNVLHHTLGHFSPVLSPKEKQFFLGEVERYKAHRIPLSVLLDLLRSWAVRFEDAHLECQTLFEPYPEALMAVTDSGKGRPLE